MANSYVDSAEIVIQPQTGTDRSMFATFGFPKPEWVSNYEYEWQYTTDQGVWFKAQDKVSKTSNPYTDVYSAPSNATQICLHVKYNSKKHKVKRKNVSYFTSGWHAWVYYVFGTPYTPTTPQTPTAEVDGFKLTASVTTYDENSHAIEFQVVKNDESVFATGQGNVVTSHAAFTFNIEAGNNYKVRARSLRLDPNGDVLERSAWSEYSSNVGTIPSTPEKIKSYELKSSTSVQINWDKIPNAKRYELEYTTNAEYFDSTTETQSSTYDDVDHAILFGLSSGETWYFRLRAINDKGNSGWSEIQTIIMGTVAAAPTTWSETSSAVAGDQVKLYWVHNSQDGSSQRYAEIELTINGDTKTEEIKIEEADQDRTGEYAFDTKDHPEGSSLYWRVRTKGVIDEYGEWSVKREVKIYAPPTVSFSSGGAIPSEITTFPIAFSVEAAPVTQNAVSWNVQIIAKNSYPTVDPVGNDTWVLAGDPVFSEIYQATGNTLVLSISAGELYLENGEDYILVVTVAMDSGLTAELTSEFAVTWNTPEYYLDAEIGIDYDTLSAYIRPFAETSSGETYSDLLFSVYRREYDGRFVLIASDISGDGVTTVCDPHPALDAARYRIVATSTITGLIGYSDLPEYPVEEPGIILQWDENWRSFGEEEYEEDDSNVPVWAGSMLRLPYNVDVQDEFSPDVTFANYIGREHPVSYYGTQKGATASWSTVVPAEDKETIMALRKLAIYMGDVYVRESSGSGYWAHVQVSFGIKHNEVTVPVTLKITRVDGGA